jgi:hypothetical protein
MSALPGQHGEAILLPGQPTPARRRRHHTQTHPIRRRRHVLRSLQRLRATVGIVMLIAVIAGALGLGDELKLTILIIGAGAASLILKTFRSA